jgi:hypothetical protein
MKMENRPFKDKSDEWLQNALTRAIELQGFTWSIEIARGERLFRLASKELLFRALQQIEGSR